MVARIGVLYPMPFEQVTSGKLSAICSSLRGVPTVSVTEISTQEAFQHTLLHTFPSFLFCLSSLSTRMFLTTPAPLTTLSLYVGCLILTCCSLPPLFSLLPCHLRPYTHSSDLAASMPPPRCLVSVPLLTALPEASPALISLSLACWPVVYIFFPTRLQM